MKPILFLSVIALLAGAAVAGEAGPDGGTGYDDLLRDLVTNLEKDRTTAHDAAIKLARLGRHAIPVLAQILGENLPAAGDSKEVQARKNPQLCYCAVLALSRIKLAEAARPLMAVLKDATAGTELRTQALEAQGLELIPDAGPLLQTIAAKDADIEMRIKAHTQLSLMPVFWSSSEKLFVESLSDPIDEIRIIASKQCWFTRIYLTATDKLIELSEKDSNKTVRSNAILALGRMRVRKAVPAMVRLCAPEQSLGIQQQALKTLVLITGVHLKENKAVVIWWNKHGRQEYEKLENQPAPTGEPSVPFPSPSPAAPSPQQPEKALP